LPGASSAARREVVARDLAGAAAPSLELRASDAAQTEDDADEPRDEPALDAAFDVPEDAGRARLA
jgi:hypothetical protein